MRSGIIAVVVVASLVAVGLFGVFGISMANYNGRHSCPLSALSSDNCAPFANSGPLAEAFHHISGLQNFAQSAVSAGASFLALFVLLIAASPLFGPVAQRTSPLQISSRGRCRRDDPELYPSKRWLLRWIALREKKYPHAPQRVHGCSRSIPQKALRFPERWTAERGPAGEN